MAPITAPGLGGVTEQCIFSSEKCKAKRNMRDTPKNVSGKPSRDRIRNDENSSERGPRKLFPAFCRTSVALFFFRANKKGRSTEEKKERRKKVETVPATAFGNNQEGGVHEVATHT